jgi:hypothetical protein
MGQNGEKNVALELLTEEKIEISGFGGIRERVLVMDPRQFGHYVREECWPGFGACVYSGPVNTH